MKQNWILATLVTFICLSAQAGTEDWFSHKNAAGGVVVRDRFDSGKDRDASVLVDLMQTPGTRVGNRILKSLADTSGIFSINCVLDLSWNESECRIDLKPGKETVINGSQRLLKYSVQGKLAQAWLKALSRAGDSVSYMTGDKRLVISGAHDQFEFSYIK